MDILLRIQRLVAQGRVRFTVKADDEMEADDLDHGDVLESILNARLIGKTLRSRSPKKRHRSEKLYAIQSFSNDGTLIYTKGAIGPSAGEKLIYHVISAKIATR